MAEITKEIGLDAVLTGMGVGGLAYDDDKTRSRSEKGQPKEIEAIRSRGTEDDAESKVRYCYRQPFVLQRLCSHRK